MTRSRLFAAVLVAGHAWGSLGCSLLWVDRAPPPDEWASAGRANCSGFGPAGTDIIAAGLVPLASAAKWTEERRDPTAMALVATAGMAVFLLSATSGVDAAETCAEYTHFKRQQALAAIESRSRDAEGREDEPCPADDDCIPRLVCSAPGPLCPSTQKPGTPDSPRRR